MRIVLMIGLPGSGKSTWLAERGITAISSDGIRKLLTGDATNQSVNGQVFLLVRKMLRLRLKNGQEETYIDATNLTKKERHSYVKIAREFGAEVEALYFDVPLEVCKERNRKRERVVPDEAMDYLAGRFQPPNVSEGFTKIVRVSDQTEATDQAAAAQSHP